MPTGCPFCKSIEVPASHLGFGAVLFKCGTNEYQGFGNRVLDQSALCKLTVKYNLLMKLSRRVVITVDADIEAGVPGTSDGTMHHVNRLRKEVGL
jgi:hypothetical protein